MIVPPDDELFEPPDDELFVPLDDELFERHADLCQVLTNTK